MLQALVSMYFQAWFSGDEKVSLEAIPSKVYGFCFGSVVFSGVQILAECGLFGFHIEPPVIHLSCTLSRDLIIIPYL
ncbi:hypothetical protein [Pseudoalteromonas luteoviolacea]|uniref:Uncharacterized protein n=1 Tax=Pseudoalteromonas luteoviolacea S4060-1 TaxID=1365257 RepID=A0A167J158_9GAMM|nr:hypothetical protein [Pseudoalteromonas luteoviolacea]KZN60360.1 hypothetical protein N478_07325 [Pseudoalteromonas luteoviolacea S4060-1]